jgi:RNA polymerase sigma-B factor
VLSLRFVEDRTQQEIADILGTSQYHVSRLLDRYLRELRERISEPAQAG